MDPLVNADSVSKDYAAAVTCHVQVPFHTLLTMYVVTMTSLLAKGIKWITTSRLIKIFKFKFKLCSNPICMHVECVTREQYLICHEKWETEGIPRRNLMIDPCIHSTMTTIWEVLHSYIQLHPTCKPWSLTATTAVCPFCACLLLRWEVQLPCNLAWWKLSCLMTMRWHTVAMSCVSASSWCFAATEKFRHHTGKQSSAL
jgi:hypothetical protein